MDRKAVSGIMLMLLLVCMSGLARGNNLSNSKGKGGTQADKMSDIGPLSSSTAFSEGFEGAFPADNWLVQDKSSNNGLDYWDDTSYRSQAGSKSGWCAQIGSQTTTTTVLYENFEGAFPGSWTVEDFDSASGNDLWDDTSYRTYEGSRSAWCAEIGTKAGTTATIFYEDFEGAWPGLWFVGDWNSANGLDYWGDYYDTTHPAHQGSWDGYCADEGVHPEFHGYDDNMDAYMYRNVSLSGYSSVTLSYWYWLNCETNYDYLEAMYYSGGSWYYIDQHTGNISAWQYSSVSIPASAIYVGLRFHSDSSVCIYPGAFVDQVQLTGIPQVPNNSVHEYDNDMEAYMYHSVTLSGYSSVTLSYRYWLSCESGWDNLYVTYFDTSWHDIDPHTGNSGGWQYSSVSIPTSAVYVGFHFSSDSSVCNFEGAYIDQVTLSGVADIPNTSLHTYDDNMDASMVRKYTIDASTWASATLNYWAWYQTESSYDYCQVIVTNDAGAHWYNIGEQLTGIGSSWSYHTLPIPNTYFTSLFNVGFMFHSDGSIHYEGVYLDGIVMEYELPSPIYIHADGSIDPPTAPIHRNENLYTFTDNIYTSAPNGIVIEKDGITLDGAGYMLQGPGGGSCTGILLQGRSYVTIRNLKIKAFGYGIYLRSNCMNNIIIANNMTDSGVDTWLSSSSYNTLTDNIMTGNWNQSIILSSSSSNNAIRANRIENSTAYGIGLYYQSNYNDISENNIASNLYYGIYIYSSLHNNLFGNRIRANNWEGVRLYNSTSNSIYHNNFIGNGPPQASTLPPLGNIWDEGYPSGGNYWSDYTGLDLYKGSYQNETGSDGIGDTPYLIGTNNQDNYPLMGAWAPHSTQYAWSMFHHDLSHSGYSDSPTQRTNKLQWTYTTGGPVYSSAAITNGKIYVGSYDKKVYCLDASNGTKIWDYTTGGNVSSSPVVADGKVYVGSDDGKVYCLDALTGSKIWNYSTGNWVRSSPAVTNGKVYVGSDNGKVYCLNASSGMKIWEFATGNWVRSSPAVVGSKVYVGSYSKQVYCLDALTGTKIWNYTTGNYVYSSPSVVDGKVYVGSFDNKVYCLNASTGTKIWSYNTGSVSSSPAVAYGRVYVGTSNLYVYCLNASTGALKWIYPTGGSVTSSPSVADGKVYIGGLDNAVYCLDALTGTKIWNYTTGHDVYSSPAIADGTVFVGSFDSRVYAFGNIIKVPEDYPTVQAAVNAAITGDTILVAPGVYHEFVIIFNKTLTILGEKGSGTTFTGGGSGTAFTISGPGTSGTNIAQVTIISYAQGVSVDNSAQCRIFDNIMYSMTDSGVAVKGSSAVNTLIYNNIFQNNYIAVNLTQSSTSNTVYGNTISYNNIGLILKSGGNTIYANTISQNNYGIKLQSSNDNFIYWNNFDNYVQQVDIQTSTSAWDKGYPMGGNYWSNYLGVDSYSGSTTPQTQPGRDGIGDTPYTVYGDVQDHYPLMKPFGGSHDIGILQVICSKTIVGQGYTLTIQVTILSYGIYTETRNIKIYANSIIAAGQDATLPFRSCTTLTFTWTTTGFAKSDYNIKVYATPITGDDYTADNTLTDGVVKVVTPGDVNADGIVDILDVSGVSAHWSGPPEGPLGYNSNFDVNNDGNIDILEMSIISAYWTGPPKGPLAP